MANRFALKAATDDLHRELDAAISRLDLSSSSDYRAFLRFQARTVPPIEAALQANGLGEVVEGWSEGRRTPAIEADLAALGEPLPPPVAVPEIDGIGELLGTAYVLEGSRLGGRVLKRQVADGLPVAFLGHPDQRHTWPTLVAALDRLLYSDSRIDEAKDAARRCFTLFLNVAREAGI